MEDLLKKEESSALGKTVSSLLDTTMTKAAEKVFGNIENKASYVLFDNALSSLPVNAAQSSLSLQMCLYFDAIFYIIWVSTSITSLVLRSDHLDEIWFVSLVAATALFILINPPRIYLGCFESSLNF